MEEQKENQSSDQKLNIPLSEKLKSIPGYFGVHLNETPKYKVMHKDGDFEIREYQPLLLARVIVHGQDEEARKEAFMKLAGYIFGGNKSSEKMDMTSPVLQGESLAMTSPVLQQVQNKGSEPHLKMSFVLPSEMTAQSVPVPDDPAVHIEAVPAQTWATITYTGDNAQFDIDEKTRALRKWLAMRGQDDENAPLRTAQYDSPNTISFLKHNEVQILLWSDGLH